MNRQEELAVGRRLLGHIDGRTTDLADTMFRNRVSAYSCRERASLERNRLFRERPIFMGLSTRLPKPGARMAPRARSTFTPTSSRKSISGLSRRKENLTAYASGLVRMDR